MESAAPRKKMNIYFPPERVVASCGLCPGPRSKTAGTTIRMINTNPQIETPRPIGARKRDTALGWPGSVGTDTSVSCLHGVLYNYVRICFQLHEIGTRAVQLTEPLSSKDLRQPLCFWFYKSLIIIVCVQSIHLSGHNTDPTGSRQQLVFSGFL